MDYEAASRAADAPSPAERGAALRDDERAPDRRRRDRTVCREIAV